MDESEQVFSDILNQGEKILFLAKPNKRRMVLVNALMTSIYFVLVGVAFLIWGTVVAVSTPNDIGFYGLLLGLGCLFLLFFPLIYLLHFLLYRKTFYAITDHRVLIRSGIVGVDYKSLDVDAISSVNIQVNFLDKCMKANTGSVTFASSSIPMTGSGARFGFHFLDRPYDAYREIKERIDRAKEEGIE